MPGWTANSRSDGVRVAVALGGVWVVIPTYGRPPVTVCSCCNQGLRNATAAMMIADEVYPLR